MNSSRILVIDDEIELGHIIVDTLKPIYDHVSYCSKPADAKIALQEGPFNLVLSDVSMPEIPGGELIRILRSQGNLVPVVFLTAHASKDTILTALRLGVSDVLEKPFDANQLIGTINRVLEIERRKRDYILDSHGPNAENKKIEAQKKMLGLLYVANEKQKAA